MDEIEIDFLTVNRSPVADEIQTDLLTVNRQLTTGDLQTSDIKIESVNERSSAFARKFSFHTIDDGTNYLIAMGIW
ncbi:MAG: hypothetical protein LBE13_10275 [Bacteroidales bacterium]|jgi:hypothetical protein|nr:hypothetical protein [Bacteroidales bacterium]